MIRRPPRSPLFPSTPLSRSDLVAPEIPGEPPLLPERPLIVKTVDRVLPDRQAQRLRLLQELPHSPERSEEHTSELQSLAYLVCRLLLEKKKRYYHLCHETST